MLRNLLLATCIALVFALAAACGRGSNDEPSPAPTGSAPVAEPTPTKAEEPAPPPPVKMDQAAFTAQLPSAACDAMQKCKNEEMRGYVEFMMMFMGGFGSLDKTTGLAPIMEKIGKGIKNENRFLLNQEECNSLLSKLLDIQGMTGAQLSKSLESNKATFDAAAATQCVEGFKTLPSQCSETKQLTEELKMGKVKGLEQQFQKTLVDYLKSCGDAIQGTVDDGGACDTDQECKVGKCRRAEGGETKVCKSGS